MRDYVLSYHLPVIFETIIELDKVTGSRYIVNCAYLQDPLVVPNYQGSGTPTPSKLVFLASLED
jgi:hypothetical protein